MTTALKVVHVSPWVTTGGGIETLLRWHRDEDARAGLDARQLALFDRAAPKEPAAESLRIRWHDSLGTFRRRFERAMAPHAGAVVVYHNAWGLPFFADLDRARRRVAYLHGSPTYLAPFLPSLRGCIDGFVAVNRSIAGAASAALPLLGAERSLTLLPAVAPARPAVAARRGHPFIIGYAGRLERLHKRVDRLPQLVAELERQGAAVQVEVLGDGSLRSALERAVAGKVVFHGWRSGADYQQILQGWDAIVFFSDSEGSPLALLEAMAAGVIPFFPQIGESLGDEYAAAVERGCHYPLGDMAELARRISALSRMDGTALESLRQRAKDLTRPHSPEAFGRAFAAFVHRISALPPIAPTRTRGQMRPSDLLPLGFVTRAAPGLLRTER